MPALYLLTDGQLLGTYHEPYYLLLKADPFDSSKVKIAKHTIPYFIPLNRLEEELIPHDQEVRMRQISTI